jgi:hypothetical protein
MCDVAALFVRDATPTQVDSITPPLPIVLGLASATQHSNTHYSCITSQLFEQPHTAEERQQAMAAVTRAEVGVVARFCPQHSLPLLTKYARFCQSVLALPCLALLLLPKTLSLYSTLHSLLSISTCLAVAIKHPLTLYSFLPVFLTRLTRATPTRR